MLHRATATQVGGGDGFDGLVRTQGGAKQFIQMAALLCIRGDHKVVPIAAPRAKDAGALQVREMNKGAGIHAVETRLLVRLLHQHLVDQQATLPERDEFAGFQTQPVQRLTGQPDRSRCGAMVHGVRVAETGVADR